MSMMHPIRFLFLSGLIGMVYPFAAWAQPWKAEVTVNVTGTLLQPACTPNIQRQLVPGANNTSNTVTLPDVYTDNLNAAGKVYGNVTLQFRASGCTGNVNHMWVHFTTSKNVDSAGRIRPDNGKQLYFEIRNNNINGSLIKVGGSAGNSPNSSQGTATPFSGSHPENSNRIADKYYGIRYYAGGVVVAGNYSAPVTANFKYY